MLLKYTVNIHLKKLGRLSLTGFGVIFVAGVAVAIVADCCGVVLLDFVATVAFPSRQVAEDSLPTAAALNRFISKIAALLAVTKPVGVPVAGKMTAGLE